MRQECGYHISATGRRKIKVAWSNTNVTFVLPILSHVDVLLIKKTIIGEGDGI